MSARGLKNDRTGQFVEGRERQRGTRKIRRTMAKVDRRRSMTTARDVLDGGNGASVGGSFEELQQFRDCFPFFCSFDCFPRSGVLRAASSSVWARPFGVHGRAASRDRRFRKLLRYYRSRCRRASGSPEKGCSGVPHRQLRTTTLLWLPPSNLLPHPLVFTPVYIRASHRVLISGSGGTVRLRFLLAFFRTGRPETASTDRINR